ncbi:MAG: tol-pal system-associated acyl-CoA thioesterase [Pseudomonadota bacterium]
MKGQHHWLVRVYYEDTDLAGVVYYANYFRYIERARTEFVRMLGIDQLRLKAEQGIVFAVHRVEADFLRPAVFDDELLVETTPVSVRGARLVMKQDVLRGSVCLFTSQVTLVCMTAEGRPARLPQVLKEAFAE